MKRNQSFKYLLPIYGLLLLALSACSPMLPGEIETPAITPTPPPVLPDKLLPRTLHYLANGQVFRTERDGTTVTQITFESGNVNGYDVSRADGSIAYIAENQLLLVNADGSNRRVLVDGGPRDENDPTFFKAPLTNPVFSPDGQTIAYAHTGLNLYDVSAGISRMAIEDQYSDPMPDGMRFPIENYPPVHYSPDGTKLLLALGHWEVPPSHAVYDPATNALVRYAEVPDYINCCSYHGGPVWSPDSSSFYGIASVHDTCCQFGELWRIDAGSGAVTRMFRTENEMINLSKEPYLAPDGQLYFFFGTYDANSGFWDAPVLELVRSVPDGVTERTVLRDENFVLMNEALWAPDASFVILSSAPARNWNGESGVLELYYTDRQKSVVWLAPLGHNLKWGP